MKINKNIYNSVYGILLMSVNGIISFIKISLLINILGSSYNGLNNLYSQIFSFLMIGESGISLATTSLLYKPIAENKMDEINKIISGSRKILTRLLMIIFILIGLVSSIVPYFIKDNNINYFLLMQSFILFSIRAIIPQYLQPLKGYVSASQNEYILKIYQIFSNIFIGVVELYILYKYKKYIPMLVAGIVCVFLSELLIYIYINKWDNRIRFFSKEKDYSVKKYLKELIKVNLVGTVAKSVDPILISKILGLTITSLYSNYNYIFSFISSIIGVGLNGFTHYFGDIFVKKHKNMKSYFDYYIITSNFIASFFTIMCYFMVQDFMILWINKKNLFDNKTIVVFVLLIYIYTMMKPINVLIVVNKYFNLASKSAIYETILNLLISIILINKIGVLGVLLGSIFSFLLVSFWYFPYKTYREIFKVSSFDYFVRQLKSFVLLIVLFFIANKIITNFEVVYNWETFIKKGIYLSLICLFINSTIYILSFKEIRKVIKDIQLVRYK